VNAITGGTWRRAGDRREPEIAAANRGIAELGWEVCHAVLRRPSVAAPHDHGTADDAAGDEPLFRFTPRARESRCFWLLDPEPLAEGVDREARELRDALERGSIESLLPILDGRQVVAVVALDDDGAIQAIGAYEARRVAARSVGECQAYSHAVLLSTG
jgi:hypothetical protein